MEVEKISKLVPSYYTHQETLSHLYDSGEVVGADIWTDILVPWKNLLDDAFLEYYKNAIRGNQEFSVYKKKVKEQLLIVMNEMKEDYPEEEFRIIYSVEFQDDDSESENIKIDGNIIRPTKANPLDWIIAGVELNVKMLPGEILHLMYYTLHEFGNRIDVNPLHIEDFFYITGNDIINKSLVQQELESKIKTNKDKTLQEILCENEYFKHNYYGLLMEMLEERNFVVERGNKKYSWKTKPKGLKSKLAGFISVCKDKGLIEDDYSATDFHEILKLTFKISIDESSLQPEALNLLDKEKYKKPFEIMFDELKIKISSSD